MVCRRISPSVGMHMQHLEGAPETLRDKEPSLVANTANEVIHVCCPLSLRSRYSLLFVCLSVCLSVCCLSVCCLSVCVSVCQQSADHLSVCPLTCPSLPFSASFHLFPPSYPLFFACAGRLAVLTLPPPPPNCFAPIVTHPSLTTAVLHPAVQSYTIMLCFVPVFVCS